MTTPKVLAGIREFREYFQENRALLEHLATEGQSPEALFIGCSDSRVPPEVITGTGPGDLFVLRNLGNVVPPYGAGQMAVGAVVEYAVLELGVGQIIVCGHTDCGGIRALDKPLDWSRRSHIARWIEHARPARTKVEASGRPAGEQHLATVRENVLLQLEHLRSYDPVREGERAGRLAIHGWVYRLETGAIEAYDPEAEAWVPVEPAT